MYKGKKSKEQDYETYQDILFNLLIQRSEFAQIENLGDFIELLQLNLIKIVEFDCKFEILFVEQDDSKQCLYIYSKDKCSIDLEGKDILLFLIQ